MPLPVGLTTITVTGTYTDAEGNPLAGSITFTPSTDLTDTTGAVILRAEPVTARVTAGAMAAQLLPCTDNTAIAPTGWTWTVSEYLGGSQSNLPARTYSILLPHTLGATVDLSALTPVTPQTAVTPYLLASRNLTDVANPAAARASLGLGLVPSGDTTGAADHAAIQGAINTASTAGGGPVYLGAGTFTTTLLTLPTNVALTGQGSGATVIQLAAAQNTDLIQTTSFAALTGTDTSATPYGFQIRGITLDGNRTGQNSGTGNCLSIYAYGFRLEDVVARNAIGWGIWSEWGSASAFLSPNGMESFATAVKCHGNNGGTVNFIGPHDSQWSDLILVQDVNYSAGKIAFQVPTDGRANGTTFARVHTYGGAYDVGVLAASAGVTFADCQFEGAQVTQMKINASQVYATDCRWFWGSTGANTTKGIILGDAGHTNLNGLRITGKIENCSGGAVDVTYATGGGNLYGLLATYVSPYTVPSPAVTGSPGAADTATITVTNNAGTATADTRLQTPGAASVGTLTVGGTSIPNVTDQDPLALGYATTHPWAAEANGTQGVYQAGYAYYMKLVGYGMTTNQLRIYVGAQSGNICVGVYANTGSGSTAAPGTLKATTGSIPCPAPGQQTVTVTGSVTIARGDWVAISADNTSVTFLRSAPTAAVTDGTAANQASAFPLPATANAANGSGTVYWIATP